MPQIRVLDDQTINKIAAGEVIERPVSVVKELVENAIDAGSTSISIEIKGGGIDLIRVTDNGCGLEKDGIPLAFMRHATSKIRSVEDLINVSSLGFRGEALSSVAAVSKVELISKTKDSMLGYCYRIQGGRQMSFDETGAPDGTTIIVKDLFYNTPARRKFLKSAMTEGNHVTQLIEKLILSHPDISFKYTSEGRVRLTGEGKCDTMAAIYNVFGRDAAKNMNEISYDSENCSISGFVAKPEMARGNKDHELFFVNGRFIKSKILSSAVEEAYKPYLMLHRFPFVVLYYDIPSELLDVNVHPAKAEIRFAQEQLVRSLTINAVTEGITRKELISDALFDKKESEPVIIPDIPEPFEIPKAEERSPAPGPAFDSKTPMQEPQPVQETLFKEGLLSEENRPKQRLIGQIFDTYWLIEYEDRLYMIDQHAAHEKVLYERIKKQVEKNSVISQLISPPYIVTLSDSEAEVLSRHMAQFNELGFTVEHFGGKEYSLSSVPAELFGMSEQDYFLSVLDGLLEDKTVKEPKQIKDRIATMACKAAVKGNMKMSYSEADALISELLLLDNPYNCPHGRPTIISFSQTDIEKMFKRIV